MPGRLERDLPFCVSCMRQMELTNNGKTWIAERAESRIVRLWRSRCYDCPRCGFRLHFPLYLGINQVREYGSPANAAERLTELGDLVITHLSYYPLSEYGLKSGEMRSVRNSNQLPLLDRDSYRIGDSSDE